MILKVYKKTPSKKEVFSSGEIGVAKNNLDMDSGLRIIIFGIRSGFETFKNFDIEVLSFKAHTKLWLWRVLVFYCSSFNSLPTFRGSFREEF